jgi:very-short-patch-repair endonuclease
MRANPTPAEQRMWLALRANRFSGMQFTRQSVIAPYIVDFVSKSLKLVIEIDGDTHGDREGYDASRTDFLKSLGYRVVRFSNAGVMGNLEGVLLAIGEALSIPPLPNPPPEGGGSRVV